jgi:hypothetical protein
MIDPIEKTRTVPLTPPEAFTLFINDLGQWWPSATHSVSGSSGAKPKIKVEARKNGKIIEIAADGTRHIWGTIIGWEDGRYVSFSWHPGRDEDEATVVSVNFHPDPEGCRVELTHGGFDILGPQADAVSTSYLTGWDMVLGCYCGSMTRVKAYA